MLRLLKVSNFALIESLEIAAGPGLSVFTGETGAGKSILIEALGFLLGQRGSVEWLRAGAQRLEVEGHFDPANFPSAWRPPKGPCILRRELDASGRSRASLNGRSVTGAVLAELGEGLAEFHAQHEHQALFKPAAQRDLLDAFGGLEAEREKVALAHGRWHALESEKEALKLSDAERERRMDLCRFQAAEIDAADPRPGEEEELEAELPRLKNAARLAELASGAVEALYRQEGSAQEALARGLRLMEEMARMDPSLREPCAALDGARQALEEAVGRLGAYQERESRPERLDALLSRQEVLARLRKKYGATLEEVRAYREKLRSELASLEHREERLGALEGAAAEARAAALALCESLHVERAKAARKLAVQVLAELRVLAMESARFSVAVEMEEGEMGPRGADAVEFLIAPNPGEPLKPLRAVASGGELSRVMLALKTVLAGQDRSPLLVFDEIDAGIGGATALTVGRKLAQLGASRQVLCVTHLPQIACFAGSHWSVAKLVSAGRTRTRVSALEGEARLEALAQMLGGRKATQVSRKHAQELLEAVAAKESPL